MLALTHIGAEADDCLSAYVNCFHLLSLSWHVHSLNSAVFSVLTIYRVAQKWHHYLYALSSSNINRFSNFFNCQNQEKICNYTITKDPTTPQVCRYTTLWNVRLLKATIENKTTCVTTHFKKLTTGNNVFIVSVIVSKVAHLSHLQFLHHMFNVSTLLLEDALKPPTPLTNGAINETHFTR